MKITQSDQLLQQLPPHIRQGGITTYIEDIVKFDKDVDYQEISVLFHRKLYRAKQAQETSYRTINHWDSQGLLPGRRKDEDKWRRFDYYDIY